ncbi:response regulator [Glycomyces tritici]|uniref:Response regulator transcription factor n=1 Tax=Glycomyces tritici TaxID=2665176 RepID=A0ABT7YWS3_9ACTN|nr:response regulator transcription factor [Glycomyces tritici]MDN3243075.1 response regulator transcription factor [Glycomyces tritici]
MTIRVLVADDQDGVRRGLCRLIDAQSDMAVVGEAADGLQAVALARSLRPDVALVDIRMPRLDGLDVTRLLADASAPEPVRVVIVTTFDHDEYVHTALQAGACGFVLKRSGPALLAEAVRAAVAGESLISPAITVRLLQHLAPVRTGKAQRNPLTPRETELARLVARGLSNADIAAELFISVGTVKTHLANIQAKLGAANRVGIAAWCWQTGRATP